MFSLKLLFLNPVIYIPLWFYSNGNMIQNFAPNTEFTFHFGFILTSSVLIINNIANTIYIPLWFYSNILRSSTVVVYVKFTFHFGFILTARHTFETILDNAFTFHFGFILTLYPLYFWTCLENIYIPLWFYSNFPSTI